MFFDAAGTLLHLRQPVGAQYAQIAAEFDLKLDPQALEAAFYSAWKQMPAQNPGTPFPEDGKPWWRELVFATLQQINISKPVSTATRNAWFERLYDFYALPEAWKTYPEVPKVLAQFSQYAHLSLGLISNWDRRLYQVLEGHQLTPYFDHIIVSSEVGFSKPHPTIFGKACQILDSRPDQCLHIGDHPEYDWKGAAAAGIHSYPLDRKFNHLTNLHDRLRLQQ